MSHRVEQIYNSLGGSSFWEGRHLPQTLCINALHHSHWKSGCSVAWVHIIHLFSDGISAPTTGFSIGLGSKGTSSPSDSSGNGSSSSPTPSAFCFV